MVEFEIINITTKNAGFTVEIEVKDRTRKRFCYPIGEGWRNEIAGEYKFIRDINKKLEEQELIKNSKTKSMDGIIKTLKNKKFKLK